jgi:hypothetical protein
MKRAFKQGIWKEKNWKRYNRKQRGRQPEREKDEQVEITHRPVTIPVPWKETGSRYLELQTEVRPGIWTPFPKRHNFQNLEK